MKLKKNVDNFFTVYKQYSHISHNTNAWTQQTAAIQLQAHLIVMTGGLPSSSCSFRSINSSSIV